MVFFNVKRILINLRAYSTLKSCVQLFCSSLTCKTRQFEKKSPDLVEIDESK